MIRSAALVVALVGGACGMTKPPYVSVLGVTQLASSDEPLRVMVEIHNQSHTPLKLSQLDYTFTARSRATGSVDLHHQPIVIPPQQSSVVDIDVPVDVGHAHGEPYHLEGILHGFSGDTEVSFKVVARGELSVIERRSGSENWGIAKRAD